MANKRQRKKQNKIASNTSQIKRMTQSKKDEFNKARKAVMAKLRYNAKLGRTETATVIRGQDEHGNAEMHYDKVPLEYFLNTPYTRGVPKLQDIKSWEAYHAFVEKAKNFTDRAKKRYQFTKNEQGIVMNELMRKRLEANSDIAVKLAQEELEKKGQLPTEGGRTTLGEQARMMARPTIGGIAAPKPFDFDKVNSWQQLLDRARNLEQRAHGNYYARGYNTYKQHFIDMLEKAFNSDETSRLVIRMIQSMDDEDFFDMSQKHKDVMHFNYYYVQHNMIQADDADLQRLKSYVESYYEGNESFDLKGF